MTTSVKDECPGCCGEKLVSSALCIRCSSAATGAASRRWKGGITPCPDCGGKKSRDAKRCSPCAGIARRKRSIDGRMVNAREWQRVFRLTSAGKLQVRASNLKQYGLTPDQYDKMLAEQGGVCASCHQEETHRNQYGVVSLAVDHDHTSGVTRGLLCGRCNRALGLLGDSAQRIQELLRYRESWGGGDAT